MLNKLLTLKHPAPPEGGAPISASWRTKEGKVHADQFWSVPTVLFYLFSVLIFFLPSRQVWNDESPYLAIILSVYFFAAGARRGVFIPGATLWLSLAVAAALVGLGSFGVHPLLPPAAASAVLVVLALPYLHYLAARFSVGAVALLFVFIALLHAQWGVLQFALQSSLSLQPLGETLLDPTAAGVAKFSLGAEKIVRAYGPHPHANPFGGWMLLGLIALQLGRARSRRFFVPASFWLLLGTLLSFSRAAWAGALIWLLASAMRRLPGRQAKLPLLVVGIAAVVLAPLAWGRLTDQQDAAAAERLAGGRWALGVMYDTQAWIAGVGFGNYVPALAAYLERRAISFLPWQLDYVHSVPLLLLVELGAAGVLLLAVLFWSVFRRRRAVLWLAPIIPAALLDHYLITQPAPLLVLLVLLVLVRLRAPVSAAASESAAGAAQARQGR